MTGTVTLPTWLFVVVVLLCRPPSKHTAGNSGCRTMPRRRASNVTREIVPSFDAYLYFRLGYRRAIGIWMLLLRWIVLDQDGLYRANSDDLALLGYYANAIEPLVAGT